VTNTVRWNTCTSPSSRGEVIYTPPLTKGYTAQAFSLALTNQDVSARPNPRCLCEGFTNYVVAQSNRFAHATGRAVAESPAKAYNPVIIWGGSGVGKAHLLRAIYHSVEKLHPGLTVKFVTADILIREFTSRADEGEQDTAVRELKKNAYADCDGCLSQAGVASRPVSPRWGGLS
jgi:chromosomal replication initiation ATPase DnaA